MLVEPLLLTLAVYSMSKAMLLVILMRVLIVRRPGVEDRLKNANIVVSPTAAAAPAINGGSARTTASTYTPELK